MKKIFFLLFFAVSFSACFDFLGLKSKEKAVENESLVGFWVNPTYNEDYTELTYTAATSFKDDHAEGVAFKANGEMIERANAGWCGTPPITYTHYDGNYNLQNEKVLNISVPFWGGIHTAKWEVLSQTNTTLKIKILKSEYVMEGK